METHSQPAVVGKGFSQFQPQVLLRPLRSKGGADRPGPPGPKAKGRGPRRHPSAEHSKNKSSKGVTIRVDPKGYTETLFFNLYQLHGSTWNHSFAALSHRNLSSSKLYVWTHVEQLRGLAEPLSWNVVCL